MVRNFHIRKGLPYRPARFCAKKTGAPGLEKRIPIKAKIQNGEVIRIARTATTLSITSFKNNSQESSGVERRTSIGLSPIASKVGRAIWVRMNEEEIHASTPCSSQVSTAAATRLNSVPDGEKMT